ncbi:HPr family phosphocarrier protein [Butyrivibrio sp. MC2013]|uniref:HPr family phosphocarrier protein n=1 Tax=Butyrivibrio sp. MC2013 TaxID=1280686 RepID=UPI0003FBCB0B|nr:HPr family phosphocarrier protein [Butyrivibrio sp. MC2013]
MIKKLVEIKLPHGLEARPVAELVQVASKYESTIHIEYENRKVNAKSIMGMMTLNLGNGESITLLAEGVDEQEAVDDMTGFLEGSKTSA